MSDLLALDLVSKKLVTNQLVLTIGYDIENLTNLDIKESYTGPITKDHYGREVPKPAHGTINIDHQTSSSKTIIEHMLKLYDKITNKNLLIKRINITANNVISEDLIQDKPTYEQYDLFTDYKALEEQKNKLKEEEIKDKKIQNVMLDIKNKYGKNAILKGMNLEVGATTIDRNKQIGGHRE